MEACSERHCGGFIDDTVRFYASVVAPLADDSQNNASFSVCGGAQADHGTAGLPNVSSTPQSVSTVILLSPVPGPSWPVVDSSPITHAFSLPQLLGATSNQRRMVSVSRATARNRGGIPSLASTPTRPPTRSGPVKSRAQPTPSKLSILFLPLYVSDAAAAADYTSSLALQMKKLQMPQGSGLPKDFLEKFWLEREEFNRFLSQCQSKDLLFTVTVPAEDGSNATLLDAVNQALAIVSSSGGPGLPKPEGKTLEDQARHWEFLTCKEVKASATKLRGQPKVGKKDQKENKTVIHISSELTHMLAPFDYNIQYVTKTFRFKNTLRVVESEPEKFVAIGE